MKNLKIFLFSAAIFFNFTRIVLALDLPDLAVESVEFLPRPKEEGSIDLVKIRVINQGKAAARDCVLSLSCKAVKCNEGSACDELSRKISADIPVPALKPGEKAYLEWRPESFIKWVSGKYSVGANIDKYNVVQELNETNNINQSAVYIASFSPKP